MKFLVKRPFTHFCVSLECSLAVYCDTSKRELGFGVFAHVHVRRKIMVAELGRLEKEGRRKKKMREQGREGLKIGWTKLRWNAENGITEQK